MKPLLPTSRKNILFVIDLSTDIGLGHATRAIALSKHLFKKQPLKNIYCLIRRDHGEKRMVKDFFSKHAPKTLKLLEENRLTKAILDQYKIDVIIFDTISTPSRTFARPAIQTHTPILFIGSYIHVPEWVSVVINTFTPSKCLSHKTKCYDSPAYATLAEPFAKQRKRGFKRNFTISPKNILILPGGGYTKGMVFKILDEISSLESNFHLDFVIGPFFPKLKKLEDKLRESNCNYSINQNVKSEKVLQLMKKADMAVLSLGRSMDEARSVGLPSIILSSSPLNHKGGLHAKKRGGILYAGDFRKLRKGSIGNAIIKLAKDQKLRKKIGQAGYLMVQGDAIERISKIILDSTKEHS